MIDFDTGESSNPPHKMQSRIRTEYLRDTMLPDNPEAAGGLQELRKYGLAAQVLNEYMSTLEGKTVTLADVRIDAFARWLNEMTT